MESSCGSHGASGVGRVLYRLPICRGKSCEGTDHAIVSTQPSNTSCSCTCASALKGDANSQSNWFLCMALFSVIYNAPLFYQVVLNLSAAASGVRIIPNSIGSSVGSLGYGILMAKTVHLNPILLTI